MLTGRRPASTGVRSRDALPGGPQLFRRHGYFTGRVGKIFHQGVPGDIGRSGPDDAPSWAEVVNPRGHDRDAQGQGKLTWLTPGAHVGHAMTLLADEGTDGRQTECAQGWALLHRRRLLSAARAVRGAQGLFRRYAPDKLALEPDTPQELAELPQAGLRVLPANFGMTPDEQKRMLQAYYATTTFMDAQAGRMLAG